MLLNLYAQNSMKANGQKAMGYGHVDYLILISCLNIWCPKFMLLATQLPHNHMWTTDVVASQISKTTAEPFPIIQSYCCDIIIYFVSTLSNWVFVQHGEQQELGLFPYSTSPYQQLAQPPPKPGTLLQTHGIQQLQLTVTLFQRHSIKGAFMPGSQLVVVGVGGGGGGGGCGC